MTYFIIFYAKYDMGSANDKKTKAKYSMTII